MTVNGQEYVVIKLLGKGKGGYSYLVTDGKSNYVLKQIHHDLAVIISSEIKSKLK